ncbi:MAG: formylglycine-generating enzyme family protein [Thermoguttaceae bacterium]|nr:formylglycine-generating enzyme family protein [Thermoguttaceae bacterium]
MELLKLFCLGKYEVTQAQWQAVMGNNPSEFQAPANPVEQVSWEDIQAFLAKVNAAGPRLVPAAGTARLATEMKYALPTEAQWEYACRAGTTTAFCFGDSPAIFGQYGWFTDNSGGKTHPIGGLKPNAWGLYDVHGNVWEWCADRYDRGYYANSPTDDPPGPTSGSDRVHRGGGWNTQSRHCRLAFRRSFAPSYRYSHLGFRLALVPTE